VEQYQNPPERELEDSLKENPTDLNCRADVGSDYSMDASDPSTASQPGNLNEPVPSSGFPETKPKKSLWSRWKKWLFDPDSGE
jgi:hypothetical protein